MTLDPVPIRPALIRFGGSVKHAHALLTLLLPAVPFAVLACGTGDSVPSQDAPTPPAAPADPSTPVAYQGIDVSHFQGDIDWTQVKGSGLVFAIAKATEGESDIDPKFRANWAGMKAAGLVRGAYHFFDPAIDAAAQAEHFIATVTLEPGDLPPVLDIEVPQGVAKEGIDADVRLWLDKVAAAFGVQPILYSDRSFIETYLASGFSEFRLWLAEYTDTMPDAPGDWQAWTFWQYSDQGQIAGVDGDVDRDLYQGTLGDWAALRIGPR